MATDTLTRFDLSSEYRVALTTYHDRIFLERANHLHELSTWKPETFFFSQEFRDARLAFRKRVNEGYTKGNH